MRETHEKLKVSFPAVLGCLRNSVDGHHRYCWTNQSICLQVGNVEMLNCYYAHADTEEGQQVSMHRHSRMSNLAVMYRWFASDTHWHSILASLSLR